MLFNWAFWAAAIWGRRNDGPTLEYDAIGIRWHGRRSWELPWSEIGEVRRPATDPGQRLHIATVPDPSGSKSVLFPKDAKLPTRPERLPATVGPRVTGRSVSWRPAVIGGLLATLYVVVALIPGLSVLGHGFALFLGTFASILLAFGLQPPETLVVVDQHGIRRVGAGYWTLSWAQIESATIKSGKLRVSVRTRPSGPIQDAFLPESEDFDRTPPGARTYTARVARRDAADLQAAIDHHLAVRSRCQRRPSNRPGPRTGRGWASSTSPSPAPSAATSEAAKCAPLPAHW